MSEKWKDESGVILVEAAIYLPIVIFTVLAMIYLGMVKYQESILTFQVQKIAVMGGREAAYQGYEAFDTGGSLQSSSVDFKSGTQYSSQVETYYDLHSEHLYNEWKFDYGEEAGSLEQELTQMLEQSSFLTGIRSTAQVHINNYVIGKSITVEATYGLESPKLLSYVGVPADITLKSTVTQNASNPAELVRNIDLAMDLIDFLLERFGVKDRVDVFLKKVEDIKNKIL